MVQPCMYKPRSHAIKLQNKVRQLVLKIALSAQTAEGKLLVFETWNSVATRQKNIVQYIGQMDATKVLLVDGGDIDKIIKLATQNLQASMLTVSSSMTPL